ncbi:MULTISPECIES: universal stress protein [Chelatococcus]|uniref:Universal stress protein n=1 Tax=Chelatococcus caeni TaxID=1348468 RepID=A0A840CB54_9HYPH|nr:MULTISPECIES: universal stress protein [Chelatococcus]ALA19641.1 universal stress protein [Chelatococcus sp. CO-6]MBB4019507.1 nucleotide-binding universal stress UspA family protein [Chelatococcus caeni]
MYKNILIPTDGSLLSAAAVEQAMAFARDAGAKVTLLTVVEPFHLLTTDAEQLTDTRAEYEAHARRRAAGFLSSASNVARVNGVPYETVQVVDEEPYRAIIDTAKERGCDLIAMGSHGRGGVAAVVLGSVTQKVLTHSTIPVLVYR